MNDNFNARSRNTRLKSDSREHIIRAFVMHNHQHLQENHRSKDQNDSWDLAGVTKKGRKFIQEFKIRNYKASQWSDKIMIENSK